MAPALVYAQALTAQKGVALVSNQGSARPQPLPLQRRAKQSKRAGSGVPINPAERRLSGKFASCSGKQEGVETAAFGSCGATISSRACYGKLSSKASKLYSSWPAPDGHVQGRGGDKSVHTRRGVTSPVCHVNLQGMDNAESSPRQDGADSLQGLSASMHEREATDHSSMFSPNAYQSDFNNGMESAYAGGANLAEAMGLLAASQVGSQVLAMQQPYQPRLVWFANSEEEERIVLDRAINAVLVSFAAAATVAKVITIDRDYWSGWTLGEILRNAPVHNWLAYESMLESNPVLAKMCISGVVYSLGDWSAQYLEGKAILDFDRGRMLRSGLVGFCLHGSLSHFYYQFCEWLFPFKGWWVVPVKVAFDQTIWSAIWNSIYYICLGTLRMEKPSTIFSELRATFFPLLTAGWKLWPFAHIITYGVIPVEQRLLWVDMVELVWVSILSMISNEKAEARREDEELEVEKNMELIVERGELEVLAESLFWPAEVEGMAGEEGGKSGSVSEDMDVAGVR